MELVITPHGAIRGLYDETLDLRPLGALAIRRASHVEPTADGWWTADLAPLDGPRLGPFPLRSQALAAEVDWLTRHWLAAAASRDLPASPSPVSHSGASSGRD